MSCSCLPNARDIALTRFPRRGRPKGSVEVLAGWTIDVELRLKRLVDMRKAGWVSGDLHVHKIHGENP
jgi:hypothetical protein